MYHVIIYTLLIIGVLGMFFGMLIGFILKDLRLQNGLNVIASAFLRITKKKWQRSTFPDFDQKRRLRDRLFISLSSDQKNGVADKRSVEAATEFKQSLIRRFGDQVKAVYIFGSRVRGDYFPESDLDIGVFIAESLSDSFQIKKEILFQSGKLLMKYGLFAQARVFTCEFIENKLHTRDDYLAQVAVGYGIAI